MMLSSANAIAGDYYEQQQRLVSAQAQRFARALGSREPRRPVHPTSAISSRPTCCRSASISSRSIASTTSRDGRRRSTRSSTSRRRRFRASTRARRPIAWPSARRRAAAEARIVEQLVDGGDLIRTAVPIRSSPNGPVAWRGRRERVPDRPVRGARARHDRGVRGLSAAARA